MFSKVDYIMVNVSEMSRSVAFYRDTIGLPLKFESPGWSEFETGATVLALHLGAPAPGGQAGGPGGPPAGTCTIGFTVEDLDAAYVELQGRGARFVMPPTDQPGEGIRLAVCIDPDGLGITFAQMLRR
ncbi:MAG TPA: VOC family protein [Chthonomonadaceae bacterium]|nr:VOC family protein [Chthonomonadaceae bacterium]